MSLKLYFAPGACSFVPHVMLEAAQADYEPMQVRLHKGEHLTPEFKAMNPNAQVPVLVDSDTVITQLVAICLHLEAKFPAQNFLPASGLARAKALEMLAWMNNTVHPTFTHVFLPHHFTDNETAQAELKRFNTIKYRKQLAELDAMVAQASPWLGGTHFGPLDAYALTLMRWGSMAGIEPQSNARLWAFAQKVAAEPAASRAIARERLQLDASKK